MSQNDSNKPMLTVEELAIRLSVSSSTVFRWLYNEKIAGIYIGKRILFDPDTKKPCRKKYISPKRGIAA